MVAPTALPLIFYNLRRHAFNRPHIGFPILQSVPRTFKPLPDRLRRQIQKIARMAKLSGLIQCFFIDQIR